MSEFVHSPATAREGRSTRRIGQISHSMRLLDQAVTPSNASFHQAYTSSQRMYSSPMAANMSRFMDLSNVGESRCKSGEQSMISEFSTTINKTNLLLQPTTPHKFAQAELDKLTYASAENPGIAATAGLFGDFKNCLLQYNSPTEVFELLDSYEEVCSDYELLLTKVMSQVVSESQRDIVQNIKRALTNEKQTWRLLTALYRDRLTEEAEEERMTVDSGIESLSEKNTVEEYFKHNSDIRQAQIVIDWLEQNSADTLSDISEQLQHYSGRALWENTLYHLKKNAERGEPPNENFVSEMDPDAPTRTRRPIHELDREDEARLLTCVFSCIRAGKINEAQDLCTMHGQPWRVAALEGWRLFHDPNMVNVSTDGGFLPLEGNARRDMWKVAAWISSNNAAFSNQEKAIYGSLCGNLKAMLDVSGSWQDAVWAYFKTMVDMETERLVQRSPNIAKPWQHMHRISLPDQYFMQKCGLSDLEGVFDKIACLNEQNDKEAKTPYFFIQRCIILKNMEGLLDEMVAWLEDGKINDCFFRFFAHLLLFLQSVGEVLNSDKCTTVLEAYVNQLISDERTGDLVATYAASLPPEEQLSCYSSFLETIADSNLRRKYVDMAKDAGLDVAAITKNVVERIRASVGADTTLLSGEASVDDPMLEPPLSADDKRKIEAIEWLVFDSAHRGEALKQSNAVIRSFLASRKHTAARQTLFKIPRDSIDVIHREWHSLADKEVPLPPDIENAEREHLCLQAYLSAQMAFGDWFKHFHSKPRSYVPANQPSVYGDVSMSDLVAEEQRKKSHDEDIRRWKDTLNRLCDVTRDKVYNVLLFPNGGWLVDARKTDSSEDDEEGSCRRHQMVLLRRLYVPSLCDILLNTLLETGSRQDQCAKLADVIASEENKLYELFTKEEGRRLLGRIQDAMIEIL